MMDAYLEWERYAPVLDVLKEALDRSDWTEEDWEMHEEWVTQVGSERYMAGMKSTAMSDARRIVDHELRVSALRNFSVAAPLHAEACREMEASLWI